MPAAVLRHCLRMILSPAGGIVAAAFGLLILLGCLSIGGTTECHSSPETAQTFAQEDSLNLRGNEERDVYYPKPYVSPPYLELTFAEHYELLTQQPTHFRVRSLSDKSDVLHWKAKGVRGKVTQVITPGPPALPAEPVPVVPAESAAKDH
ncbi:MAG TPA: hypothetical protein VFW33_19110 [Gemmataceae bacterium]|nr:hypothetical protein [Gemmataceae bacterium]